MDTIYAGATDWSEPVTPDAEWAVWNAPRPLFGEQAWEGKFRAGIFYAAARRFDDMFARWAEENARLDAAPVELLTDAQVTEMIERRLTEDGYTMADFEEMGIEMCDLARQYHLPWAQSA